MARLLTIALAVLAATVAFARVPSQEELRLKYAHRSIGSVTCADVRAAVQAYGYDVTEMIAFQYGMTRDQHARALRCLGIKRRH